MIYYLFITILILKPIPFFYIRRKKTTLKHYIYLISKRSFNGNINLNNI
jgi:hypothetical protein